MAPTMAFTYKGTLAWQRWQAKVFCHYFKSAFTFVPFAARLMHRLPLLGNDLLVVPSITGFKILRNP
jgi:hypothetical protein